MNLQTKFFVMLVYLALSMSICGKGSKPKPKHLRQKKMLCYFELGGSSGRYAVNYSRYLSKHSQRLKIGMPVQGFLCVREWKNWIRRPSWLSRYPLEVTALYGKSNQQSGNGFGFNFLTLATRP